MVVKKILRIAQCCGNCINGEDFEEDAQGICKTTKQRILAWTICDDHTVIKINEKKVIKELDELVDDEDE
jgi:hypothetical protein